MFRIILFVFAVLTAVFFAANAHAGSRAALDHVRLEAHLETPLTPGKTAWVAIRQTIDAGWHSYWRNPGEAGMATTLAWTLPEGVKAGEINWPTPKRISNGAVIDYGYENAATLLVRLTASAAAKPGKAEVAVNLLICEHVCIPEQAVLDFDLRHASGEKVLFDAARRALPTAFPGTALFASDAHRLFVRLEAPWIAGLDASRVAIYPASQEGIADSSVPALKRDGSYLVWSVEKEDGAKPSPVFDGVLQVADKGAYAFHALSGPVIATAPERPAPSSIGLWTAIALAFLGGVILNLMPCVLPVLSMKALSLAGTGADTVAARREGWFYLAGVMASFGAMAAVLLALKASGAALGWGFQLQSPLVVLLLTLLIAAVGMNLLGVFELPLGFAGAGDHLAQSGGSKGAFFTGALAVVVASPCTAPFMGTALGFALTQPLSGAAAVFLALGLGFAAPFTVVSWSPALIRLLPKPGAWMNTFKQALAFPMFATAIWLLWVLGRQNGTDAVIAALAAGLVAVATAWLLRLTRGIQAGAISLLGVVAVAAIVLGCFGTGSRQEPAMWAPWSQQALAAARQTGKPVLVDFSAAWCVTCLVNERVALNDGEVVRRLKQDSVVTLKGDWTNPDPAITAMLHHFGRDGVPLYVLYQPDGHTEVLPQILTPHIVLAALSKSERTR